MKHRITVEYREGARAKREQWTKAGWAIEDIDHEEVARSLAVARLDAEKRLGATSNEAGLLRWLESVMTE